MDHACWICGLPFEQIAAQPQIQFPFTPSQSEPPLHHQFLPTMAPQSFPNSPSDPWFIAQQQRAYGNPLTLQGRQLAHVQQLARGAHMANIALQDQFRQQTNMAMAYTGFGTPSNPIDVTDSPPQQRVLQTNTMIPNFTLPGGPLNNGWPTPLNPFAGPSSSKPVDPAQYLSRLPYDYNVPNPSQDEIKELLANIRPDEDIKLEDKDAIVSGLAPNMRLMKHQQMGLAWMQKMEESRNKGGILADEMGLGKTIQRYFSSWMLI
jgi:hypothetical protein